ncbi:hypothetical protein GUJ93_ZPchr0006g43461 [Zizania palustris]|uniref:Uncharacterized protein n=2 Tax=Zizania palustris TaxID=103762 RepID=A0A8J5W371_ZIZPA|nr:hypothetical protein GUJ93_ZPchr0006g43461 [Zizania palustris]
MDPPPPFDHPHHHYYPDHHFTAGSGGVGAAAAAAPARSRYEYGGAYEPRPHPYHLPDQYNHHPRVDHHLPPAPTPPPPPLPSLAPHHRHDGPHFGPPLRALPDAYYHDPSPHPHYHGHQRHGDDEFLPADEIRRVGGHHHHHTQLHQQLPWEEAEEERRRFGATHQLRLSPSGSWKRQRCAVYDCGDLESTSSSGPPPRRQRQPSYAPDDSFVDRTTTHPGYVSREAFSIHSDSKGSRKIQMPIQMTLPGSPHATGAGYPRRVPQKSAPTRVSVWQRIEENPTMYEPSSPLQEVHISPCKSNNAGPALKELASAISVDCKGKSADGNDGDSSAGTRKNPVKKNEKVLASILVKPSMVPKEKEVGVKKVVSKPDKVHKNVANSNSKSLVSTTCPGAGVKKVKKIVIKKIVRKISNKCNQTSCPIVSEKKDSIDAPTNASEKEEGEITTSSFEKDVISAHDLIAVSDTAGFGNGVNAQAEENNIFTNPCGRNAAPIKSTEILDLATVSGNVPPAKEGGRGPMNPIDNIKATLAIEFTEMLDKSGNERPMKEDDTTSIGSAVNASFVYENNSTQEVKIPTISGEIDVAAVSNSVRVLDAWKHCQHGGSNMEESKVHKDVSVHNAGYVDGITTHCYTTEISGNEDAMREGGNILISRNEENALLVNNFNGSPSAEDICTTAGKDTQKKEGMILICSSEKSIDFLGDSVGTCRTTEFGVSYDAHNKEDNKLIHSSEKYFMPVNSCGALNNTEVGDKEDIHEKEDRIPMESILVSTYSRGEDMQVNEGRMPMELGEVNTFGGSKDIQEKEERMHMGSSETDTLMEYADASNTTDVSTDEDTWKKESHHLIKLGKTDTFETMQHTDAPSTEVIMSMSLGRKVAEGPMRSNERHVGTIGNSADTLGCDLAGRAENNQMEDLVNYNTTLNETDVPLDVDDSAVFDLPSSRNVESTHVQPFYDPMEDSTSDYILNIGLGKNITSKATKLMDLHSVHMPPDNDSLIHYRYSSSVSGNYEQSVPTALTLGSNIYLSSAEADEKPEKRHELVEGKQGLDVTTAKKLVSPCKTKVLTGEGLINTGIRNWLTLPPSVNNMELSGQYLNNGVTVSEGRLGLDHTMEDTSIILDHDITKDMDRHGGEDAFFSQDHSIRLCSSDLPPPHLLAPKESSENQGDDIVLPGLPSTSSVNVLGQCGYQMVDIPVDNLNKPIPSTLESSAVMDSGQFSSQLCIDLDHTNISNTENPGVGSNGQHLLSSWIEAIVSEAKKELQPCKSTLLSVGLPDNLLAPKEGSRKTVVTSAVKSPQIICASSTLPKVAPKQVSLPGSSQEPTGSNQNVRHRTWHRGNIASINSSLHASQPLGLPPKLPQKKNGKAQNSYIRKGNALIRNPLSGNHPHSSSSQHTQNKLNKPVVRRSMHFVRKADSNDFIANSNISVERPKTPPLPLHTKSISGTTNLLEPLPQTLQKQHDLETEKEDPTVQSTSGIENTSIKIAQKSELSDASKVVYVRPKSNKLLAAQRQHPGDSVNSTMDKSLSLQAPMSSDLYFKKRKNQIVLSSCSSSDGLNTKDTLPAENSNSDENKDVMVACSNNGIPGLKDRPHKALQATNSAGCFSHVWTLNGQQPHRKAFVGTSHMRAFPRILPWKRKTFCTQFRYSHTSLSNVSSARIVRKLLQTRKRDMIYTVSTDGFSLRKSGVLSVGGSSLKWSRSLEKRSQKVNKVIDFSDTCS